DPRHGRLFAQANRSLLGAGHHRAVIGNAEPGADAGVVIDEFTSPRGNRDFLNNLLHEVVLDDGEFTVQFVRRFLIHDLIAQFEFLGIVRVNNQANAVLELRNDFATAVVRGGVGGKQNEHVDIEANGIAANLHVALFQDVE